MFYSSKMTIVAGNFPAPLQHAGRSTAHWALSVRSASKPMSPTCGSPLLAVRPPTVDEGHGRTAGSGRAFSAICPADLAFVFVRRRPCAPHLARLVAVQTPQRGVFALRLGRSASPLTPVRPKCLGSVCPTKLLHHPTPDAGWASCAGSASFWHSHIPWHAGHVADFDRLRDRTAAYAISEAVPSPVLASV